MPEPLEDEFFTSIKTAARETMEDELSGYVLFDNKTQRFAHQGFGDLLDRIAHAIAARVTREAM